ncbi:MAG: 30S ribosomal protein S12 methylthiotransferase RimO [Endomicrobium sp.]|jgi:ribosomal protein S12 methylthiotransferase|nr:30S ribosomal protein S12 methylthiotransferase RimO [Endomicrobium sp.]
MQKVAVIVLGCPKNIVEAEYLLGILNDKGFKITNSVADADIAIIHTCSFIKKAQKESENTIRNILNVKKKTNLLVYVSGCLSQMLQDKMLKLFPDIDGFVGTGTLQKIPELILNKNFDKIFLPPGGFNNSKHRVLSSNIPSTYLKIAEGCQHRCSFCIIPSLRGNYESRTIESLVNEAKALSDHGVKELILIAQDTTGYGKDIYGIFALDKLLAKLAKLSNLKWIRLLYAYPSSVTSNLLDVFNEYKNICNYIDIPIQHISRNILSSMKRPLNTGKIIEKIKTKLPEIVLRTSVITGFPGETKEDVRELISFLNKGFFQYIGVFEYSNQNEAESSKLKGQIKNDIAKGRKIEIEKAQYEIFKSKIAKILYDKIDVLVESCVKEADKYRIKARSYFQSPEIDGNITLTQDKSLQVGNFYNSTLMSLKGYDINAKL